jgi:hypothetical protein
VEIKEQLESAIDLHMFCRPGECCLSWKYKKLASKGEYAAGFRAGDFDLWHGQTIPRSVQKISLAQQIH